MPVPVHLVSGFLGTGKTSAIRAQLEARRGERIAVIVNDFGEASLDATTLEASEPFRITNIPGGCVCCTAPEGFVAALGAVLEEAPDRLLIEPTGLARPQDLIDTMGRSVHAERLALAPVVVLVDPRRLGREAEAELGVVRHQVEAADIVVANRTDLCSEEDLTRFDHWVRGLWPEPLAVHRTSHGRIPAELLEWPAGEGPRVVERHVGLAHPRHSTEGFGARSWRWPRERLFSRDRLLATLQRLEEGGAGAALARFKGVFRTPEGVFRLEVAGGSIHEELSSHRRDSRVDLILTTDDPGSLARAGDWLEEALLDLEELEARSGSIELAFPDGSQAWVDRERLVELADSIEDISTLFPKRSGTAARLRALLDQFELPSTGSAVIVAADGFASEPIPLHALREGVLLHSLEGEPLPDSHGGPFRLLIPEEVPDAPSSCANVKTVARIVVRAQSA